MQVLRSALRFQEWLIIARVPIPMLIHDVFHKEHICAGMVVGQMVWKVLVTFQTVGMLISVIVPVVRVGIVRV